MTFDKLIKRLKDIGGEEVDEAALKELDGVDLTQFEGANFTRTALYILPIDRSYSELKAVAYTACRMLAVYAFEEDNEADFALFGVPYLDYKYAEVARAAILKNCD